MSSAKFKSVGALIKSRHKCELFQLPEATWAFLISPHGHIIKNFLSEMNSKYTE
jgi:hypothetical protein